tara:strand:+ start:4835 stop:5092 length:258 start_codon:yes stop_codon:yes gene_type:complete
MIFIILKNIIFISLVYIFTSILKIEKNKMKLLTYVLILGLLYKSFELFYTDLNNSYYFSVLGILIGIIGIFLFIKFKKNIILNKN